MCEANDLIKALKQKETREARILYNAHRFTSSVVYKTLTGKDVDIKFSWEKDGEEEEEELSQEEIEKMRRHLQKLNEET